MTIFNLQNCNRIKSLIMISTSYSKFLNKTISSPSSTFGTTRKLCSNLMDIHPEVSIALTKNQPIVALESTVITHGMPYPENLQTALNCEDIIRKEGAVPATIAIIDGRIKVGLTRNQFDTLSNVNQDDTATNNCSPTNTTIKCSRRDLAYVTSQKLCGGTTVAGTMIIAKMAGIKVFSTGGIGGVHRNGHDTFDISADLIELGKTPVTVVSAGVKSILDIPKTLEYLETHGVTVATYQSPNGYFPAFYSRSSGLKASSYNFQNTLDIAKMIYSSFKLNLNSGILIGVPIPIEYAIEDNIINDAIDSALIKAKEKNITGKLVTPFLLDVVSKITKGHSLKANIALLKNNAKIASQISIQLSKFYDNDNNYSHNDGNGKGTRLSLSSSSSLSPATITESNKYQYNTSNDFKDNENFQNLNKKYENMNCEKLSKNTNVPVIIGASILDIIMKIEENDFKLNGATYQGNSFTSGGGVGRNLAEGIHKLHHDGVHFISAVGKDEIGIKLKLFLQSKNLLINDGGIRNNSYSYSSTNSNSDIIENENFPTSICTVVIDKAGDCKIVIGDMKIHNTITPDLVRKNEKYIKNCPIVIMDANIPIETMSTILDVSNKYNKPVFFQPTDMRIAHKPFKYLRNDNNQINSIKMISPNIHELYEICYALEIDGIENLPKPENLNRSEKYLVLSLAKDLLRLASTHFDCIVLTLSEYGVMICRKNATENDLFFDENFNYINYEEGSFISAYQYRYYKAQNIDQIINVSGAGDSFTSGFIAGILKRKSELYAIGLGQYAAHKALKSHSAVPEKYFTKNENENENENLIKICKPTECW